MVDHTCRGLQQSQNKHSDPTTTMELQSASPLKSVMLQRTEIIAFF